VEKFEKCKISKTPECKQIMQQIKQTVLVVIKEDQKKFSQDAQKDIADFVVSLSFSSNSSELNLGKLFNATGNFCDSVLNSAVVSYLCGNYTGWISGLDSHGNNTYITDLSDNVERSDYKAPEAEIVAQVINN
jgi:hypothetical protein